MKKTLFIILCILWFPQLSEAARLHSFGMELQSVTSGVEWDTTDGSPTINTTTVRSGVASLRANPTAAAWRMSHKITVSTTDGTQEFYIRAYIYIVSYTNALDKILSTFNSNEFTGEASIRMNSDGTLELWDDDAALQRGLDSAALNLNTWYRIELQGGGSTISARIDGVEFASGAGTDLLDTHGAMNVRAGAVDITTCDIYFDDIAVNDNKGTVQNSWPGAGSIIHMRPDSAGDAAATTGLFSAVDEVTPNDATDYVEQDTIAAFNYNFEASSVPGIGASDTITLVQLGTRQRPETAASAGWTPQIKSQSGGTTASGTATTHDDTTWQSYGDLNPRIYKLTSYTDPQAGGAWTPALLNTMIAGLNVTDATPNLFVSTLWALVEYVAVVAGGAPYDQTTGQVIWW